MPGRRIAGFISAFYNPLQVPNAPTIGTATGGDTQASVEFTAPSNIGGAAITAYYAVSNTGISASNTSSPINVAGLINGTSYSFTVWALNAFGPSPHSAASGSVTPAPPYAFWFGGSTGGNVIDRVAVSSLSNATDFADFGTGLPTASTAAGGSNIRAVLASNNIVSNAIQYFTYAAGGVTVSFGNLTASIAAMAGCSNNIRAVFAGGDNGSTSSVATMNYVAIATTGNATSFGNLSVARGWAQGCATSIRGVFGGGNDFASGTYYNIIDYITIATTGNATDFGDLTVERERISSCSNATRGIWAGGRTTGGTRVNIIDYVTMASTGNATDFGDMLYAAQGMAASCNATRGLIAGGQAPGGFNNINYITIDSAGNAIDFGDLSVAHAGFCATCDGNPAQQP